MQYLAEKLVAYVAILFDFLANVGWIGHISNVTDVPVFFVYVLLWLSIGIASAYCMRIAHLGPSNPFGDRDERFNFKFLICLGIIGSILVLFIFLQTLYEKYKTPKLVWKDNQDSLEFDPYTRSSTGYPMFKGQNSYPSKK